ncbi:MAG: hypothetical protein JSV33_14405 [bacterium]|nr:MAG: hypothetical protein JSV33_14405 [bacterium]
MRQHRVAHMYASMFFILLLVLSILRVGGAAGTVAGYILVVFLPGLAIGRILFRGSQGGVDTLLHAGVLSPFVSVVFAVVVLLSGFDLRVAFIATSVVSLAVYMIAGFVFPAVKIRSTEERSVLVLAAVLAILVALPLLANPVLRLRSDAWFHAAVSESIAAGGIPPTDPYYAGIQLRYFWAYHILLLLLRSSCGGSLFDHMAAINVIFFVLYVCAVFLLAGRVGRRRSAPVWAVLLTVFGVNVCGWVFLAGRGLLGDTAGMAVFDRMLGSGVYTALQSLSFRYVGSLAFFLDKFLVGSPFAMSLVILLLWMYTVAGWLRTGNRSDLAASCLYTASAILFHTVVGLSILLCGGTAFLALAILSGLRKDRPVSKRALQCLLMLAAALMACIPYLHTILSARNTIQGNPFTLNGIFLWTVLAAGALPIVLYCVRLLRDGINGAGERCLLLWISAVLVLGTFARMPHGNVNKFVYLVFLPVLVLAGDGIPALLDLLGRWRIVRYAVCAVLLFSALATFTFAWTAYIRDSGAMDVPLPVDKGRLVLTDAEQVGYRWIREKIPTDAAFLNGDRNDIPVLAARRQLWTAGAYPEVWGYDDRTVRWREDFARSCYRGGPVADSTRKALSRLAIPVYCVVRPGDVTTVGLERGEGLPGGTNREVFSNEAFVIFEIFP